MDSSNRHDLRQEWHVGKQVVLVKTIRQTDLKDFARLMQVDGEKIEQSESCDGFPEERVAVPVMLLGGLIGAAIDRYFCEAGSSCLNQYLEFIAPAYAGDTVTATLEIDQVQTDRPIVRLKTACTNQYGQALVTGQAVILMHKEVNRD
jgi:3-hydroxybutyryl-CoA dehydratase